MPNLVKILANNVRILMDERGMNIAELTRRSGLARRTVERLPTGENAATLDTVEAIAKAFDIEPIELLTDLKQPVTPKQVQWALRIVRGELNRLEKK